jgi:serine protease inhibitor
MTMEGARNETAVEMGQTLRLPKDLRQEGARPWRLDSFHEGFAAMQRRCSPPRDHDKEEATRKRIADLRKELDAVNLQLLRRETAEFRKKALHLVTTINELENQVGLPELNIANAVWGEKTYPFDPAYLDAIAKYYGKDLARQADFVGNYPAEADRINRWVELQTRERIKDLVPKKPPGPVRMILVNAIYFKGDWSEPFLKTLTREESFKLADGSSKQTSLMRQGVSGRYAAFNADGSLFDTPSAVKIGDKPDKYYPKAGGFQIAELPYKGNKLAMTVILPNTPKGLETVQKQLTGESLPRWLGHLKPWNMQVKLPRFRMETDYGLNKPLARLGMKEAFKELEADFTGMSKSRHADDNLSISAVLHKAFVEVNEEGTEAAAATAVIMVVPLSQRILEPFVPDVFADRPFLFLIRDVETEAILFMGRMTTPTK